MSVPDNVWLVFTAEDGSRESCSTYYSFVVEAASKNEAIRKVRLLDATEQELAEEDEEEDADATDTGTDYERGNGGYTAERHEVIR